MDPMPITGDNTDAREALLFPGQGSQSDEMGEAVARHRPELLELCRAELGLDPFEALDRGTAYVQPALYCASVALWAGAGFPLPEAVAGHSLGELAALAAAGVISEADGLRLAVVRGRLMQEAAESGPESGMLALLGGDSGEAERLAGEHGLTLANDNAPGQIVVSGPTAELDAVTSAAKGIGVKTRRLPVAGGFHSPAMEPAVEPFARALAEIDFREAATVVYSGVTARPFDDYAKRLAEALTHPVRWRQTLLAIESAGIRRLIEVGPGKVLRNLARRTLPDCESATLEQLEVARV